MVINFNKSSCVRIGPRFNVRCVSIISLNGDVISWMTETRYLGIYMVSAKVFKCSLHYAECAFHRAVNAIFGKVGCTSSEEVITMLSRKPVN